MLEPGKSKSRMSQKGSSRNPGRIQWKRIFFYFLLLCFLGAAVFVLFFSPYLGISEISISGTRNIDEDEVRNIAEDGLSGKYLGFIPKNNMMIARSGSLSQDIKGRFRLIKDVRIDKKFPDTLRISVLEHEMKLILCSSGSCYYADESGSLFPVGMFSKEEIKEENYAVLNDTSGADIDQKNDMLSAESMNFMFAVRNAMDERLNIGLEREMETPSRVSSDLRVITKEGWKVFFNEEIDPEKEIEMLRIVLDGKIDKERRGDLEYVDLRADNKVFYKFKGQDGEEMNQEGNDSSASSSSSSSKNDSDDKKDSKKKKK